MAEVAHPQFERVIPHGGSIIVCFRVGFYQNPPPEVIEAKERIAEALRGLSEDRALIRAWSGSLAFHEPDSKMVNPEITDAMREEFLAASVAAFPGHRVLECWDNQSQGLFGYSVKMAARTEDSP